MQLTQWVHLKHCAEFSIKPHTVISHLHLYKSKACWNLGGSLVCSVYSAKHLLQLKI